MEQYHRFDRLFFDDVLIEYLISLFGLDMFINSVLRCDPYQRPLGARPHASGHIDVIIVLNALILGDLLESL